METLKLGSKCDAVKRVQAKVGAIQDGDFGLKTEALVKEWQKRNKLTVDGIVGPKTWGKMFGLSAEAKAISDSVVYCPIEKHITVSPNRSIKYIVVHYTAGFSSEAGRAMLTRNVFLNRSASADFVVDDETIVQINPDLKNRSCWAVGDGNGKYGITNKNSISIEMCSTLKPGTSPTASNHDGWSITEAVLNNTIKLIKILMQKFDVPISNVVRHYDASRKSCPGLVGWNDNWVVDAVTGVRICKNNSQKWLEFKARIK